MRVIAIDSARLSRRLQPKGPQTVAGTQQTGRTRHRCLPKGYCFPSMGPSIVERFYRLEESVRKIARTKKIRETVVEAALRRARYQEAA